MNTTDRNQPATAISAYEHTAEVRLWTIWQYICYDCGFTDNVPNFYGDAENYNQAARAINRHKIDVHHEWQPANPEVES